jgi:hypothetical protein
VNPKPFVDFLVEKQADFNLHEMTKGRLLTAAEYSIMRRMILSQLRLQMAVNERIIYPMTLERYLRMVAGVVVATMAQSLVYAF